MEDWEKALLVEERGEIIEKIEGFEITYRQISWYKDEELQSNCFVMNPRTKSFTLDSAEYTLKVLRHGILKGPWNPNVKEAILKKFKPEIKDLLVKKITRKLSSDNAELKKK